MIDIQKESVFAPAVLAGIQQETVQIEEHNIAYEVFAGGEQPERTMILCHGAFCTRHATKVLAGKLAENRPNDRILLVDVPWHGDSTTDASIDGATVETYAAILKEFVEIMRETGVIEGKLAWFGWSMGGSIGMLLDLDGAGIDELILVNSAPVWESLDAVVAHVPAFAEIETVKDIFQGVMSAELQTGVTDEERDDILRHYDALTSEPHVMVNDLFAISPAHYDIRGNLSDIKAKTMIVSGTGDTLAIEAMQDLMESEIKGAIKHLDADNHAALMKQDGASLIAACFVEVFCHDHE